MPNKPDSESIYMAARKSVQALICKIFINLRQKVLQPFTYTYGGMSNY